MATVRNHGDETVGSVVHAFERAGLGKAPFRCVGFEVRKFQACPGAPVQAGGSCDSCGQAITLFCWIKGSDGCRFKVGSDCVAKTGDHGLRRVIDRKIAAHKRELAHKRADSKVEQALAVLETVKPALAAAAHPRGFGGLSLLDWVQWMLSNAGRKGKAEAAKVILAAVGT